MIFHLNQYIIDEMTHSFKIVYIFLLCMVRYKFFGIKVISRLGLIYENIAKMANKIFNVPNHLKEGAIAGALKCSSLLSILITSRLVLSGLIILLKKVNINL